MEDLVPHKHNTLYICLKLSNENLPNYYVSVIVLLTIVPSPLIQATRISKDLTHHFNFFLMCLFFTLSSKFSKSLAKSRIKTLSIYLIFSLVFHFFKKKTIMSQSPYSSKKILDSLNEIDPVDFNNSFEDVYSYKLPTSYAINIDT